MGLVFINFSHYVLFVHQISSKLETLSHKCYVDFFWINPVYFVSCTILFCELVYAGVCEICDEQEAGIKSERGSLRLAWEACQGNIEPASASLRRPGFRVARIYDLTAAQSRSCLLVSSTSMELCIMNTSSKVILTIDRSTTTFWNARKRAFGEESGFVDRKVLDFSPW